MPTPKQKEQRQAYLDSYGKNIEPNRRRSSVIAFEVA